MKIRLLKVGGTPLFALVGARMYIRARVAPYVAGQTVRVTFYRDGRKVQVQNAPIFPVSGTAGEFRVSYRARPPGRSKRGPCTMRPRSRSSSRAARRS